ncbi:MAG TPA: hypothetical protein VIJ23_01740 [Mycobacterium sp.]
MRANRKNWREWVSRLFPAPGAAAMNASMSLTSTSAQSALSR